MPEVHIGRVHGQNLGDRLSFGVNCIGDLLRRRSAIGRVELDAEVAVRAAGVVAGRKDQAAESLMLADDARCGGRGKDAIGAD